MTYFASDFCEKAVFVQYSDLLMLCKYSDIDDEYKHFIDDLDLEDNEYVKITYRRMIQIIKDCEYIVDFDEISKMSIDELSEEILKTEQKLQKVKDKYDQQESKNVELNKYMNQICHYLNQLYNFSEGKDLFNPTSTIKKLEFNY